MSPTRESAAGALPELSQKFELDVVVGGEDCVVGSTELRA